MLHLGRYYESVLVTGDLAGILMNVGRMGWVFAW